MKFIDLFSGIGGFRLGMEMAGHEAVGWCETDPWCEKCKDFTIHHKHQTKSNHTICNICGKEKKQPARFSYEAIHEPKGEWTGYDIRTVSPGDIPDFDCICGGFPCQAFSVAGKRGGFEDTRGTLFFEIAKIIQERHPKLVFLENVTGLLNHDGGRTFGTILNTLWELGYDAEWQLLNSKDFGVPQNRERVFIVGYPRGTSRRKVFPITGSNEQTLEQIIGGSQGYRVYDPKGISCTLASEAGGMGAKTGLYLISMTQKYFKEIDICQTLCASGPSKGRGNYNAVPGVLDIRAVLTPDREEKRQNGRRMKDPGEPMFTLTAQDKHGVMLRSVRTEYGKAIRKQYEAGEISESRHNMTKLEPRSDDISNTLTSVQKDNLLLQDTRIRRLTPRECFRLQGFPDWAFDRAAAVNSDSQLYKQAGNSVTVNVIYEIAKRL